MGSLSVRDRVLWVNDQIFHFAWILCELLLAIEVAIISYVVLYRHVLGGSPRGGEEFALLCMVWFSLLSAALAMRGNLHIRLSIVSRIYPQRMLRMLALTNHVLSLVFGIVLLTQGVAVVESTARATLPASGWSRSMLFYPVPMTGFLFILVFVDKWLRGNLWTLTSSQS